MAGVHPKALGRGAAAPRVGVDLYIRVAFTGIHADHAVSERRQPVATRTWCVYASLYTSGVDAERNVGDAGADQPQ